MRILIAGAGGIGGFFGGRLVQAGRDVTFLVRERRAQQIATDGIVIRTPDGAVERIPARTVTAERIDGPYDLVLLAVKGFSLAATLDDIAPAVGADTVIVPFLNGMRHLEEIAARFGDRATWGGVAYIASTLDDDGTVRQLTSLQSLAWGPLADGDDRLDAVTRELSDAGFTASAPPSIRQAMWDKWVFLASLGAITCLMRGTVGQVAAAPGGPGFATGVIDEIAAVATASGYPPAEPQHSRNRAMLTEPGSRLTSSLYRDLKAGRPVEVDAILGDLAERARTLGVAAPLVELAVTNLAVYEAARDGAS